MPSSLQSVVNLSQFFNSAGIKNLIYGGWALDFHIGKQTRLHDDIDNFIPHSDRVKFLKLISETLDANVLSDETYKTVWTCLPLLGNTYVETHYFKEFPESNTVQLGYPKEWIIAPLDSIYTTAHIGSAAVPVVCKELVVAMNDRWGFRESDKKWCKQLKKTCDRSVLSKIELNEFY